LDIDLIVKDIPDRYTRENFSRIKKYLDPQILLDGDFKLFEIDIPRANTDFKVIHGLSFIPADIILLHAEGDLNYYFNYQLFDRAYIHIVAKGPVRLRFLAGKILDNQPKVIKERYPFVPPSWATPTPPAPPAYAPKLVATFNTDLATAVGDLVYVTGLEYVSKVSDNSASTIPNGIFGVAYFKPTTITVDVIFMGISSGYSGFSTGEPLFVSTSGVPTHTVPTTGMVQQIGFATSTTEFFLQMMQPMRRS